MASETKISTRNLSEKTSCNSEHGHADTISGCDEKSLVSQIAGDVVSQITDKEYIVEGSNGLRYVATCSQWVNESCLTPRAKVTLDVTTHTIISTEATNRPPKSPRVNLRSLSNPNRNGRVDWTKKSSPKLTTNEIEATSQKADGDFVRLGLPKKVFVKVRGEDGKSYVEMELPSDIYIRRPDGGCHGNASTEADSGTGADEGDRRASSDDGHDTDATEELNDSGNGRTTYETLSDDAMTQDDFNVFVNSLDWLSNKRIKCSMCKKSFINPHRLKLHMKKYHVRLKSRSKMNDANGDTPMDGDKRKNKATCPSCGKEFVNDKSLQTHTSKYHSSDSSAERRSKKIKTLRKVGAGERGERKVMFRRHYPGGKFPADLTVCKVCDKDMKMPSHLKVHMIQHTKEKLFSCDVCNRAFGYRGQLKLHMLSHTGEKPYRCSFCGKDLATISSLRNHERTHGSSTVMCEECGRAFKTVNCLRKHRFTHTSERPHQCELCAQTFKEPRALKRHRERHQQVERNQKCDLCDMVFFDPIVLRQHRFIHTRAKENVCEVCGKKFLRPYNLAVHMRIHTGVKPYSCPKCERTFSQLAGLKSHAKSHGDCYVPAGYVGSLPQPQPGIRSVSLRRTEVVDWRESQHAPLPLPPLHPTPSQQLQPSYPQSDGQTIVYPVSGVVQPLPSWHNPAMLPSYQTESSVLNSVVL